MKRQTRNSAAIVIVSLLLLTLVSYAIYAYFNSSTTQTFFVNGSRIDISQKSNFFSSFSQSAFFQQEQIQVGNEVVVYDDFSTPYSESQVAKINLIILKDSVPFNIGSGITNYAFWSARQVTTIDVTSLIQIRPGRHSVVVLKYKPTSAGYYTAITTVFTNGSMSPTYNVPYNQVHVVTSGNTIDAQVPNAFPLEVISTEAMNRIKAVNAQFTQETQSLGKKVTFKVSLPNDLLKYVSGDVSFYLARSDSPISVNTEYDHSLFYGFDNLKQLDKTTDGQQTTWTVSFTPKRVGYYAVWPAFDLNSTVPTEIVGHPSNQVKIIEGFSIPLLGDTSNLVVAFWALVAILMLIVVILVIRRLRH